LNKEITFLLVFGGFLDFLPALKKIKKPFVILVGHYGSGKTEIAVNIAFYHKQNKKEVTIVDLDLIKPYFRCRLLREDFKARVIRLVAPEGGKFYADLPILLPEARGVLEKSAKKEEIVILDVGGDDLGARVLGSVNDVVKAEESELLFVLNHNRPFAEDVNAVVKKMREVEGAAQMKITGLIANSHLMDETSEEDVLNGLKISKEVSKETSIPIMFCAIINHLGEKIAQNGGLDLPILPLQRHILPPFSAPPKGFLRPPSVV